MGAKVRNNPLTIDEPADFRGNVRIYLNKLFDEFAIYYA